MKEDILNKIRKELNELNKESIDEFIKEQEVQRQKEQDFIDKKEYIEILNSIIGQTLDNDDYSGELWTEKIQMTFDLIFDTALELIIKSLNFDGEIVLNYKGNLISFTEIHGQGCFQVIAPVKKYGDLEHPEYLVDFEDLEKYISTGEQPERYYVLKTAFLALDSLSLFNNHYDIKINIDEIKDYLQENLS